MGQTTPHQCSIMKIYIVANTANPKEIFGGSLNPFKAQRIANTQCEFGIPCKVLLVQWLSLSYSLREALQPAIRAEQKLIEDTPREIVYFKRDHSAYIINKKI